MKSYMKSYMNKIKMFIINKTPLGLIENIQYLFSFIHYKKFKNYKNRKKIIYMLIPIHGNIGDQAIAYATNKYLEENFQEYEVIEIYKIDTYKYIKSIKRYLNSSDLIVLHGGGNMGNLYISEEKDRRFLINKFRKYNMISMTQTFSFTNDEDGKNELIKTKEIYNRNNKLTIIAREKYSYEMMIRELDSKIILNPDIVFYLNDMYKINNNRDIIMTCLRSDRESILGNKKDIFINELNNNFNNVLNYDTVIPNMVDNRNRENEIISMFNKFLKSKIVITDRLHGMIFCVITKTPCIVIKSLDHKVIGSYEWIKDLNYIRLVDNLDFEKIKPLMYELIELKKLNDIDFKEKYFEKLTENLKEIIEK